MKTLTEYAKENGMAYNTLRDNAKIGKIKNARKLKNGKIVICTNEEILDVFNDLYPLSYNNEDNKNLQIEKRFNNIEKIIIQYLQEFKIKKEIMEDLIKSNNNLINNIDPNIIITCVLSFLLHNSDKYAAQTQAILDKYNYEVIRHESKVTIQKKES